MPGSSLANVSASENPWRALLRAVISGVIVFLIAQSIWAVLLHRLLTHPSAVPWELAAMAGFLAFGIAYLKYSSWPAAGRDFRRKGVRFNAVPVRTVALALAAGWSTMIAGFLAYAAHRVSAGMGGENAIALPNAHGPALFAGLAMAGIVAGTVEEIAFRGFMQGTLERRFGLAPAILVSGFVWAMFHTNHSYFGEEALVWFGIFLAVATMLGVIAHRTNSVVPGILVHAGFDSAYFVAAGILQPRIAPLAWVQSLASPTTLLLISGAMAIVSALAWPAFVRTTRGDNERATK